MNPTCPTCGKTVDPLRARSVGVRDGKVVAYCSAECAAAAESKGTQLPRTRTPPAGVPQKSPLLDSGPVIEIIRDPVSGVVGQRAGDEMAPVVEPEPATAKRSRVPLLIALVLLAGGAVFLAVRILGANDESAPVTKPTPPAHVDTPAPAPVPAKPDRTAVVAEARRVLETNMASESPRVQRVAAEALSRTKDAAAIELLATMLASEKIDVVKLSLGYALARAGDERGRVALVAGLGSGRRDVKLQAGRLLALLGDTKGAAMLGAYLEVQQTRLGTAETLAALKDERAIKALEAMRADVKTSSDDRARATIALGIAGRTDVIPELQVLLTDSNFKKFAASALAQLGEPTARAVLAEELAVPSLRVEAARSLRLLEPSLDPAPFLPDLLAALASNKDTDQVQVAEAILLLAGDPAWSERL